MDAWTAGRRDKTLESRTRLYEPGAVSFGAELDFGAAGHAVSDTLRHRLYDLSLEVVPYAGGYAVVQAYELVAAVVPTLSQIRPALLDRLHAEQDAADEARARAAYAADPARYKGGNVIHYSRLMCPQPELIDVPLTKQEVRAYYRDHLADYASPERFRVRQILVAAPDGDAAADAKARERAQGLLARVRRGEDLGALALRFSDDERTRDDAGDLGYRSAGELPPDLQRVASSLKVGQVSDLVRSSDGYHILQLTEHVPEMAEPLAYVYTTVGTDAAVQKAQAMARHMADSLSQVIRTPEQGRAVAAKLGFDIEPLQHRPGDRGYGANLIPMAERLERLKPGEMYPGSEFFIGIGAAVMWVDSIAPPRGYRLESALVEYRRRAAEGSLAAKQAELDSLLRAGWSLDSLGSLWGGLLRVSRYARHGAIAGLGARAEIDSLVFGTGGAPALAANQTSGWLMLPDAAVRVRVDDRRDPGPAEIAQTIGQYRGLVLEYRLQDEIKTMKQRFPVRILDQTLRDETLPPLPPRPEL
jgi:hypothetical protein